ncbi:Transcription factor 25 [Linum perenne]
MSGRLLKKILKEKEQVLFPQHVEEEEDDGDEEETDGGGSVPAINPFDLLNDDQDVSDQVSILPLESEPEVIDEPLVVKSEEKNLSVKSNPKSKKKKKKKGKAGAASNNANKVEGTLEEALEMLSMGAKTSAAPEPNRAESKNSKKMSSRETVKRPQEQSILVVDPKHLNPENELRRIFGSKVVKSIEKDSQASSSRQVRGGARRGNHHTRKTVLVSPSEHWPRWDGSLTMEFLEAKEGLQYFRYVYSSSYSQAQRAFEAAKAIHDLNGIASILQHNPYHLDSLVTMADYFKFVGEHQSSADAVGRCLYALECAWHPMFTPFQGNCQLKISNETNKPIFTILFSHMRNLDRRGCHRSALEVCKLLLSLDIDDPTGSIFCIDYFALRAKEYAWLEQFSEEYIRDNSLWLFPNFSYSLAICRLYLEQEESSASDTTTRASSSELMKQALMLHPSTLKKLVAKVPLKDRAWTDILKHSFFKSEKAGSPSLDHLINLYVERSYLIWRLPDTQKLLKDTAFEVMETLDHDSSEAKDWACVRKEAFSSDKNEYDYLMVSDFNDIVATLPPENLQDFMVDPRNGQNGEQLVNQVVDGLPAPRDVANRNAIAVLIESILPWAYYGDAEHGDVDNEDHVGPGNNRD